MAVSSREAASMVMKQASSQPDIPEEQMAVGEYLTASEALNKQLEQLKKLPDSKKWAFGYGSLILSINAGLVGVIGNSFFRRMLMVRKGLFLTSIPSALMPGLLIGPIYMKCVTYPILLNDLNCAVCADIRGGLINFLLGTAYPIFLAAPLSAALAYRYDTVKLPALSYKNFDQRQFVDFWRSKVRYFKGQFITIAIFQTCFGMFIAGSQMQVARQELTRKFTKVDH
ncbi:transmembrane protein 126A-like isoform X2 [Acanthaster planci]|nr:transmembrane protein 126A-like isoform X2 [Acanthaster planci]XP_022095183.1 transmembrane protein 126A-like isoform X2 [Acanthaster planci]XP_022095184.1 transmembrane protein 126A-like isoform X2 [Acanthaster planci]XP_022095186.1 transmembrane protein 126A-like isoform X2 [Acanthaster planci]XP_022095187.1 transmembrane protein 126A-like isoform X2 [Acanthaster planci]